MSDHFFELLLNQPLHRYWYVWTEQPANGEDRTRRRGTLWRNGEVSMRSVLDEMLHLSENTDVEVAVCVFDFPLAIYAEPNTDEVLLPLHNGRFVVAEDRWLWRSSQIPRRINLMRSTEPADWPVLT